MVGPSDRQEATVGIYIDTSFNRGLQFLSILVGIDTGQQAQLVAIVFSPANRTLPGLPLGSQSKTLARIVCNC